MPMLRTIERPTNDTCRPNATAASMICCTRSTLEAKHATMTRPSAPRISRCRVGPDLAFGRARRRDLGVGRVAQEQVDTGVAEPGHPGQVGGSAVQRQLVELDVTGMQHGARAGVDRDGQRVRDRVVDREVLALEHAVRAALPLGDLDEHRLDPVLAALRGDQRQGELRADDRDVGAQLEQKRDRPDVVLVRVREHQRLDVVEPVLDVPEVRQDQVDAGLVVGGEQHPAVDDQQPAQMLENGHVAADFADAAQRGDPQPTRGQRAGWRELCVHVRTPPGSPRVTEAARMSAASSSICSGVAATCGSRGSPTSMPCSRRPALDNVTPPSRPARRTAGRARR